VSDDVFSVVVLVSVVATSVVSDDEPQPAASPAVIVPAKSTARTFFLFFITIPPFWFAKQANVYHNI
jgi:hypothetical protein